MHCRVIPSRVFLKKSKRLSKKYPSLKQELPNLEMQIISNPRMGIPIGDQCYKIRLGVESKGKGKSGGLRVITWVVTEFRSVSQERLDVHLITIFDKSEYSSISRTELRHYINEYVAPSSIAHA